MENQEKSGHEEFLTRNKRVYPTVPCTVCGRPYVKTRYWHRFCNAKCRGAAYGIVMYEEVKLEVEKEKDKKNDTDMPGMPKAS